LPESLESIAVADDGVLMGVRHRSRPQWGVQFHPESICTQFGDRLLSNFLGLRAPRSSYRARQVPARRILHRRIDTAVSAEAVFDAVYAGSAFAFWLDSADEGRSGGRFSFLGDAAGPLARVATADVSTGQVTVRRADQPDQVITGSFFDWLEADLAAHRMAAPELPFDFALGWVGYLGYELKAECGSPNSHRADQPDAALVFADRALVFDHLERQVYALAMPGDSSWLDSIEATLLALDGPAESVVEPEVGVLRARHDRAAYLSLIDACRREIIAGETYEVCLTNTLTAHGKLDPWSGYRRLRRANPEPFSALLRFGELSVLSASPERFLTVSADGVAESKPIKGTRPRGASVAEDEWLRHDLATSAKDRAENLMIVDLVRNDLGSCAELDSVTVDRLFDVETFATVHQLVSTVRARLRADRTAVDCVRAAFPGGSMTGAPKLRTMEIIDRLEGGPRGVYSGALGYFSLSGAVDLSIVIRTLVVEPDRVTYGVGGAIIALSDPAEEFAETEVKAAPLLRLLGAEFPTTGDGSQP
jgi:para-aminobenzoate synthetase